MLRFALAALVLAPSLFAITTFEIDYRWSLSRYFAFAVLASEMLLISSACLAGHRPVEAFRSLSTVTKLAAGVWIAAAAFVAFVTAEHAAFARAHFLISILHGWLALAVWDRLTTTWKGRGIELLLAICAGAALYSVVLIALIAAGYSKNPEFNFVNIGIGVTNVRQLGFYGIVSGAVAAAVISLSHTEIHRRIAWIGLTLGSALTFWSGGRAAIVGLLIAVFFAIWAARSGNRWKVTIQTTVAIFLGVILSSIWLPTHHYGATRFIIATFSDQSTSDAAAFSSGRIAIWVGTARDFLEAPLLGHGEGQFRWKVEEVAKQYNHPHNLVLQFLYQWGVIGTMAVVAMIWPAVRAIPQGIQENRELAIAALCLAGGLGAMSLLEGSLFHFYPTSVVVIALARLTAAGSVASQDGRHSMKG